MATGGLKTKFIMFEMSPSGEDQSRIRTAFLPHLLAIARNLAINLYRDAGFSNMAQAKRKCQFDLNHVLSLFRMK